MNPFHIIKSFLVAIRDPERDFSERVFLILTLLTEAAIPIALIGDLLTHESFMESFTIIAVMVFVSCVTSICLHYDKLWIAIRIIVLGLVFGIIPSLFFYGGGLYGGGVIWIIFAYMYVGLVLKGRWRPVMFFFITMVSLVCYVISYYYPELVFPHSQEMFYVDSFISLVLVGILCYGMAWAQGHLFNSENIRARKEAERAEELTRSQNRFFSSMSHEIRTPINSILGLNELILRDPDASDDIVRDASGIQGAGKMLLALINDILDFSKIESGSMDIVPVDYRIGDLLSEIVNMLWLRAQDKGLGFDVSVDPEVPTVLYGDEVRIKQIIINLLNNAVKYTQSGRVGLHVESTDLEEDMVELRISVSDTGMGIKKEDIPYLFNAFKRIDEGKNRHIEGTGLGLSIVKQLVELMGGTVAVNSVYGEGSEFTVTLRQKVSDHNRIGELNIHNQQLAHRSTYESSFIAPQARILIVDDNEMNLEVESRLLEDTDMTIDQAHSGKEALELCLQFHYDVVFMDHLMPEMDGVECREAIKNQAGGLNRNTPVIVLTANAGSENRKLYTRAGFDGYLVKPVSGEAMEEMLIRHISRDKMILRNVMIGGNEEIHAAEGYAEKLPVLITSSSMCDLPDAVIRKLRIPIIPFTVRTQDGVFKDGIHVGANELVGYIRSGKDASSSPPDEAAYTAFFAGALRRTHHVIHIALTTAMSKEYEISSEAAKAFNNVTVINSECVSSAMGILVLIACKLAQQDLGVQEIVTELEAVKKRLKCSFVIDTTEYMARSGQVSHRLHSIAEALNIHPSLAVKNDKAGIGGVWIGRTRQAYRKYIRRALPPDTIPDPDVAFITYVDVPEETLTWIAEEIRKTAYFERVIFKQASAAISCNCGPGSFGILYLLKSNKSYNLSSFFDVVMDDDSMEAGALASEQAGEESEEESEEELSALETVQEAGETVRMEAETSAHSNGRWYQELTCIDAEAAIKNSGSEDAFKAVLKIFYDSIPERRAELEQHYLSEDWQNYTIRIHALKSSARLVGALKLGEDAQLLETAGKEGNIGYIREHHASVMEDYQGFQAQLAALFDGDGSGEADERPVADEYLLAGIREGLHDAAEAMDCDMIDGILEEIEGYAIPESDREAFTAVRKKAEQLDYEGLKECLDRWKR